MNRDERNLALFLRAFALVPLLAVVPVFMPFGWMETINGWLGVDQLPHTPALFFARTFQ